MKAKGNNKKKTAMKAAAMKTVKKPTYRILKKSPAPTETKGKKKTSPRRLLYSKVYHKVHSTLTKHHGVDDEEAKEKAVAEAHVQLELAGLA